MASFEKSPSDDEGGARLTKKGESDSFKKSPADDEGGPRQTKKGEASGFDPGTHETPEHAPKKKERAAGNGFKASPHETPEHAPKGRMRGRGAGFQPTPHEIPEHAPKKKERAAEDGFKPGPHETPEHAPKGKTRGAGPGFKLSPHDNPETAPKGKSRGAGPGFKPSPHDDERAPKGKTRGAGPGFKKDPRDDMGHRPPYKTGGNGFKKESYDSSRIVKKSSTDGFGGKGQAKGLPKEAPWALPSAVAMWFTVDLDTPKDHDENDVPFALSRLHFTSCTGLDMKYKPYEWKELGNNTSAVELLENVTHTPVKLSRPINKHSYILWNWFMQQHEEMLRTTAVIKLCSADLEVLFQWTLHGVWASGLTGPSLNRDKSGEVVAFETLELQHMGFARFNSPSKLRESRR